MSFKLARLPVLFLVLAILALSCQNGPNPIEPQSAASPDLLGTTAFDIPPGAVFESATFYVDVSNAPNQTVNVHRITAPWDENTVTWNSFGGSYDPAVVGSFVSDGIGWHSVDVTALVQDWLDGTYENYGLLLEQGTTDFTQFLSSECSIVDFRPMLEICYTTGSGTECVIIQRGTMDEVADTYIRWNTPDVNYGASPYLYSGLMYLEKQSLFWFELPAFGELAAIGDFVWFDENIDGIQDAGEWGVPDVQVNLYDCLNNLLATTFTDANGYYLFADLIPGDYNVEFIPPEGYTFTLQDQGGDDAVDSDADPVTGMAACTNLEPGETDLTWDAGLYMIPQDGCTLTIGFWKNHAGFGPQPDLVTALLPVWLGDAGGTKSIQVTTAAIAVDILSQDVYGVPSNGITKLYAQLLGAKLNIANGANGSAVGNTIIRADEFLAVNDWNDWDTLSKADKGKVSRWHIKLDDYNNGDIGPGHCDD